MGYTTDFSGSFEITPPLKDEHRNYLTALSRSRRMTRDALLAANLPDPLREAVGLPIGTDGEFYVGSASDENFGQSVTPDVIDQNRAPATQPGLWLQWVSSDDGTELQWDGGEKFYAYIEWLEYLLEKFFTPWGYTLNGLVHYEGEESDDRGCIRITNNCLEIAVDVVSNPLESA
jgi:hypothetical protein